MIQASEDGFLFVDYHTGKATAITYDDAIEFEATLDENCTPSEDPFWVDENNMTVSVYGKDKKDTVMEKVTVVHWNHGHGRPPVSMPASVAITSDIIGTGWVPRIETIEMLTVRLKHMPDERPLVPVSRRGCFRIGR
jgi:hypothetical protein